MPVGFNQENITEAANNFKQENETIVAIIPIAGRKILVLTDMCKLSLIDFPFFGKSKILKQYSVADIQHISIEENLSPILKFIYQGKSEQFKVLNTPFFNSMEQLEKFVSTIPALQGK